MEICVRQEVIRSHKNLSPTFLSPGGVVSERPSDYFFRRFVKNTRISRTEIMPINFPC